MTLLPAARTAPEPALPEAVATPAAEPTRDRPASGHAADGDGSDAGRTRGTRRPVLATIGATAAFITSDTLIKLATTTLPVSELLALRGGFALLAALLVARLADGGVTLRDLVNPVVSQRAGFEAASAATYFAALAALPLATVTSVLLTVPLLLVAASAIFGGERVPLRRWAAVIVGFAGVLLVVRPGPEGLSLSVGFAGLATLCVVARDLATARTPGRVASGAVLVASTAATAALGFVLGAAALAFGRNGIDSGPWVMPDGRAFLLLLGSAGAVVAGNHLLILAFRAGSVSRVAPFRYVVIPFSVVVGVVVFGDRPDALALLGIGLVGAAGLAALGGDRPPPTRAASHAAPPPSPR